MRILIETNEQSEVKNSNSESITDQPSQVQAINGGSPSESLVSALTEPGSQASFTGKNEDATDAGAPPEWLVEAITRATQHDKERSGSHEDYEGGAAPGN